MRATVKGLAILLISTALPVVLTGEQPVLWSVQMAEQTAIENSPEIKLLGGQQLIKRLLVSEAWRKYFPTASLGWARNSTVTDNQTDSRNQRVVLTIEEVVYDGGRRDLAMNAAISDLALSKYDYLIALNQLRFQVRQTFYGLLGKDSQIEGLRKSVSRQRQQVRFSKAELELGQTTELELLTLQNRLNEIELQLKTAEIERRNGLEELRILIRVQDQRNMRLVGDFLRTVYFHYRAVKEVDMVASAQRNRVEFDRAKAQELQAVAQKDIAESYWIPQVSVGGFYGYSGDRYPPRQREYGFNFRVSMRLGGHTGEDSSSLSSANENTKRTLSSNTSLGIYDNMDYERNIVAGRLGAAQARLSRVQLEDKIRVEVSRSVQNYHATYEAMQLADKNIALFEKRLRINDEQLRLGDIRRLDLAETEIRYLEAKNAQLGARLAHMIAAAQLEIAAGVPIDSMQLLTIR